jgi:acetyl-CoA acetyltransferase
MFDASQQFDIDGLHAQALELALRRGGLRTLTLSVELDPARLARALRALGPRVVVLTGRRASMDTLGRLVYAARRGDNPVEVFDYRGALPDTGASTVARLGGSPLAARDLVLDALAAADRTPAERPASEPQPAPRAVTSA